MSARPPFLVLAVVLAFGCFGASCRPGPTPGKRETQGALSAAPLQAAAAVVGPPASSTRVAIGMDDVALPSEEAVRQNTAALALHDQHDYAGAARGFAEAVRLAPAFLLARYNHSCALVRLGDFTGTADQLGYVLARDLLEFRDRAGRDDDLQSFFVSPPGLAIKRTMTELALGWKEGAPHGVRAMVWIEGRPRVADHRLARWDDEPARSRGSASPADASG